jgi:UDP-N-acetyl-D-galactosamine dehydrogenase
VAYDPWVDPEEARRMYGIDVQSNWTEVSRQQYDAIVYCVKHKKFKTLNLEQVMTPRTVLYDIKGAANRDLVTERL